MSLKLYESAHNFLDSNVPLQQNPGRTGESGVDKSSSRSPNVHYQKDNTDLKVDLNNLPWN